MSSSTFSNAGGDTSPSSPPTSNYSPASSTSSDYQKPGFAVPCVEVKPGSDVKVRRRYFGTAASGRSKRVCPVVETLLIFEPSIKKAKKSQTQQPPAIEIEEPIECEAVIEAHQASPTPTPAPAPSQGVPPGNPENLLVELKRGTQDPIGTHKPAPVGQPEVWAEGRQELCETLHYYRAWQGACYSTGGFVRSFMFDGISHPRDYLDSNVVISRAGGGLIKDKATGDMKMSKDQSESTVAQNLRNCIMHQNPVVIISGINNQQCQSQLPHAYNVLDYFKPTHIWTEKDGKNKIVRYRFEKLNPDKDSWWRPTGQDELVKLGSLGQPVAQDCATCSSSSLQIYLDRWMCLKPKCGAFWKILGLDSTLSDPDEAALVYDPRFLKQRTVWPNDTHEYPLVSNNPALSGMSAAGEDSSQAFWSGTVCPDCGRCTSRLSWLGWECANATCNFKRLIPRTIIPALSIREPFWPLTDSYTMSRDKVLDLIGLDVSYAHGYRINRYTIPGIEGFITHMIANKTVVEQPNGPDAMFEDLQRRDVGLRRRPMSSALKGSNYTRHFLVNYGMPYKFIAATASHPFPNADSPSPITMTRSRLNWAAKFLMTQETPQKTMKEVEEEWRDTEFNEVLVLGYFEQQKIDYHDDGEYGLGPTIATLSLGAPGTMRIKMKDKHFHGVSKANVYNDTPPLPGCQSYEARLAINAELAALKDSDPKAYRARLKTIPKDLGLSSRGRAKECLTMELGHGDVVVMHGAELQKYYEHSVEHAGKLRFALTCRYIAPESLAEGDRPEYVVERDEGGYDDAGVV